MAPVSTRRTTKRRALSGGLMPLYHQLETDLVERIKAGEFDTGDTLPTEEQICAQYGVSRITVRRALDAMIASGLIVRRRGVGTFVADRPSGVRSVRMSGSLDEFLANAGALNQQVLSLERAKASAKVAAALAIAKGEEVVRLELISSLSSGPVLYLEIFFPLSIGGGLQLGDITPGMPIVRIIERKQKLKVVRATQHIEPDIACETVAHHLGVEVDTPILHITRIYYAADGAPVEVALVRHHPERYQYVVEFSARPGTV
ncbi:MAG: GntR family transcriptional regulator [Caulobacterales bacterium]|nr:GntR family transcriptional regulator [Caulobacterales bacterium]